MTLRAGPERPCDICPQLRPDFVQIIAPNQLKLHTLYTRDSARTHKHTVMARLSSSLTSKTVCPLLLWLFPCQSLSVSDSLPL